MSSAPEARPETAAAIGSVAALWRYPVKSMLGEETGTAAFDARGVVGDRLYALVDAETGKVVSAKNPRRWSGLLDCRAAFEDDGVSITLPDGSTVRSDGGERDDAFSALLGRRVRFTAERVEAPTLEEYWPDIEGLALRDTVTDESMPEGTFYDLASVHVLTTGTLDELARLSPDGRFDPRRFRPNVLVRTDARGFVENEWVGRTLALGDDVRLRVTGPCPRCVMTTLEQGDLPRDPSILRTAAQHNGAHVGVYAEVARGGIVEPGAVVRLED